MNYYVECTWCDGFEYPEECAYCSGSGYRLFGSVPEDDVIDYEAAAAPMKLYEAFVYTGGAVHPQTYIRIVKGLIGEIVRAAMRLDGEAKEATELAEREPDMLLVVTENNSTLEVDLDEGIYSVFRWRSVDDGE